MWTASSQQLKSLGFSFDWDREINTTDPELLQVDPVDLPAAVQARSGLQERDERSTGAPAARCVLANEEVVNGVCERCGSEVVHKVKSQWMLKITAYADRLIDGLDGLDYIERVSTSAEELDRPQPPARRSISAPPRAIP